MDDDDKTEEDYAWEEFSQRDWSDDEHNRMCRKFFRCIFFVSVLKWEIVIQQIGVKL